MADQVEPVRTRETIYKLIGSVQFPDLLLEVDAATGYSEALWVTVRSPPTSSARYTVPCWLTARMRMPRASPQ